APYLLGSHRCGWKVANCVCAGSVDVPVGRDEVRRVVNQVEDCFGGGLHLLSPVGACRPFLHADGLTLAQPTLGRKSNRQRVLIYFEGWGIVDLLRSPPCCPSSIPRTWWRRMD